MSEDETYKTTIPLLNTTRDRLKEYGKKGEKYDDLLNRLMDGEKHG